MQARLQAAEHRLAAARVALDAARQRVADQRAAIGRLAASNYANGDPALMGLSVMLNSQDPAEVTTQMNTVTALMSRQTTLLDELRIARAQMVVEEAKVEKARAEVAVQRKAAAENLVRKQGLEQSAAQRPRRGRHPGRRARAPPSTPPPGHDGPTSRQLRVAKKQEERIRQLIIERAAEAARRLPGRHRRLPVPPGARRGDLAVRLPPAPDLRLLGTARRHRLPRARAARPSAPARPARSSRRSGPTSTATASTSTSAGSTART